MKKCKNWIVFPVLLALTFLLLEIPEYIFQNKDEALAKESGRSVYEIQTIKSIDTFAEKVDALKRFNKTLSTIGNTKELNEEELQKRVTALQREMDLMIGEMYKIVVGQLGDNDIEMRGMEVQVIHRPDKSTGQFVWEMGYLELLSLESGGALTFLYDPKSFKIFQVEWYFDIEAEADSEQSLDQMLISDYYGEADLKKVTIYEETGYGLISVLSEEDVYDNDLIMEIHDFMNYYWGVEEIESQGEGV